ncbi:MAG TPA: DUF4129 domain-containing protein [Chryseosolibacter sp.]|nr:DUF4129 domain-containing protein [Chryseosolibacter sp.]
MRRILLIICCVLSLSRGFAQESDSIEVDIDPDTESESHSEESEYQTPAPTVIDPDEMTTTAEYRQEKIPVRDFDRAKWKEIVGKTSYDEQPAVKKEEKKERRDEDDERDTSIPWVGSQIMSTLGYIVIGGLLVLLLYLVIKNTRLDKKVKKSEAPLDAEQPVEDIEELDIDSLLRNALAEKNYRLALRLYYLGLLKRLNESGAIAWKKDKTNRDYLAELFAKDYLYDEVRKLTVAYEYVWYGMHNPSQESFERLFTSFETLKEKVNSSKSP